MDRWIDIDLLRSLIVVGLSVSDVIGSVDGEVSSVDVVSLHCRFEQLGVVHCSVLQEVQLLILIQTTLTFMFTPQMRSSSAYTFKSYFNWPSSVRKSALSRLSKRILS
jgi:hypothetical protein